MPPLDKQSMCGGS